MNGNEIHGMRGVNLRSRLRELKLKHGEAGAHQTGKVAELKNRLRTITTRRGLDPWTLRPIGAPRSPPHRRNSPVRAPAPSNIAQLVRNMRQVKEALRNRNTAPQLQSIREAVNSIRANRNSRAHASVALLQELRNTRQALAEALETIRAGPPTPANTRTNAQLNTHLKNIRAAIRDLQENRRGNVVNVRNALLAKIAQTNAQRSQDTNKVTQMMGALRNEILQGVAAAAQLTVNNVLKNQAATRAELVKNIQNSHGSVRNALLAKLAQTDARMANMQRTRNAADASRNVNFQRLVEALGQSLENVEEKVLHGVGAESQASLEAVRQLVGQLAEHLADRVHGSSAAVQNAVNSMARQARAMDNVRTANRAELLQWIQGIHETLERIQTARQAQSSRGSGGGHSNTSGNTTNSNWGNNANSNRGNGSSSSSSGHGGSAGSRRRSPNPSGSPPRPPPTNPRVSKKRKRNNDRNGRRAHKRLAGKAPMHNAANQSHIARRMQTASGVSFADGRSKQPRETIVGAAARELRNANAQRDRALAVLAAKKRKQEEERAKEERAARKAEKRKQEREAKQKAAENAAAQNAQRQRQREKNAKNAQERAAAVIAEQAGAWGAMRAANKRKQEEEEEKAIQKAAENAERQRRERNAAIKKEKSRLKRRAKHDAISAASKARLTQQREQRRQRDRRRQREQARQPEPVAQTGTQLALVQGNPPAQTQSKGSAPEVKFSINDAFRSPATYFDRIFDMPSLKKAWKHASLRVHPNKNPTKQEEATEAFKVLQNAYEKRLKALELVKHIKVPKTTPQNRKRRSFMSPTATRNRAPLAAQKSREALQYKLDKTRGLAKNIDAQALQKAEAVKAKKRADQRLRVQKKKMKQEREKERKKMWYELHREEKLAAAREARKAAREARKAAGDTRRRLKLRKRRRHRNAEGAPSPKRHKVNWANESFEAKKRKQSKNRVRKQSSAYRKAKEEFDRSMRTEKKTPPPPPRGRVSAPSSMPGRTAASMQASVDRQRRLQTKTPP